MENNENRKYELMLESIMKEGKRIKMRNAVLKTVGGLTAAIMIAFSVILMKPVDNADREDLMARDLTGSEIEVALIAADTFFDSDLELIY
jgi:hypothetical protein